MRDHMAETAAEIDCTFPVDGGPTALEEAVERVQREAEDAVRGGCTHVILSDTAISAARAGLPMILASGAVHSHLVRQQLRPFTSVKDRKSVGSGKSVSVCVDLGGRRKLKKKT